MITKMLEMSTAHLTEDTCNKYLQEQFEKTGRSSPSIPDLIVYEKKDYGWFIPITDVLRDQLAEVHRETCPFPADLIVVLSYAMGARDYADVQWLMFDSDADPVSGLPVYEW